MVLILGSLWFWLFIAVFILLELVWIAGKESGVAATFTLLIFGVVFFFYGDPAVFEWVKANPVELLVGAGIYLAVAPGWGFVKWYLFLKEKAREYKEERRSFLHDKGRKDAGLDTAVPEELREDWQGRRSFHTRRPRASSHKDDILMWMSYWPVSMLWTLIEDSITHIYNLCSGRLERMAEALFQKAGYDDDMETPKKAPDDDDKQPEAPQVRARPDRSDDDD